MAAEYGSLPFKQQITFFRSKINIPTATWTDIYTAQHDQAFVVAGALKAELLTDFRNTVDGFIANGTGFAEFKKNFKAIVAKHGWAYNGSANWRSAVIYETNLYQSYNAGREAQIASPALRKARPYGLYRHYPSEHQRPLHAALDNVVVLIDDPWWKTWSPQNGWRCKCKKFLLSERDLERRGLKVSAAPAIEYEDRLVGSRGPTPRTVRVPKGIDPGFEYAPGRRSHPDLDRYPEPISRKLVEDNLATGVFDRWHASIERKVETARQDPALKDLSKPELIRVLRQQLAQNEQFGVATLNAQNQALLGVQTQSVYVSDYDLIKQSVSREGQELTAADYMQVQTVIDDASVVIRDSDAITVWVKRGSSYLQAVLQQTQTGQGVYLKSFRRSSAADLARERRRAASSGYTVLKDEG